MIDIGGYRLHISEAGSGAPVVFESGLGEPVATWKSSTRVAKFARFLSNESCWHWPVRSPFAAENKVSMAADLHTLLHAAQVPPPYILVGHSLGGALVQVFAHAYRRRLRP